MVKERKIWIDVLKGIGILFVIYAHIDTSHIRDIIFLFHMPLFFFLGGYVYSCRMSLGCFFVKKYRELIIPYIIFLVFFSIPFVVKGLAEGNFDQLIHLTFIPMILGGRELTGWFSVFWFVSCYFFTLLLYHFLMLNLPRKSVGIVCLISSLLAFINAIMFPSYWLIFNLNVVFIALPIFHIGKMSSEWDRIKIIYFFIFLFLVFLFIFFNDGLAGLDIDYKYSKYGTPVLGQCVSLFFIFILAGLAKLLVLIPSLGIYLSYIGNASLTLMFLHQPIQISFRNYLGVTNVWENFILTLLISLSFHALFKRKNIFSKYFLGKY